MYYDARIHECRGTKLCEAVSKAAVCAQNYTVGKKRHPSVYANTQFCQLKGISISYTDEECKDVGHATANISILTAIPEHYNTP